MGALSMRKWLKRILLGLLIYTVGSLLLFRFLPVPFTPLMAIRAAQGTPLAGKQWVPLREMGPAPLAVVSTEDQRFPDHWGFDLKAIEKAVKHNESHRRKLGASTISQQTAKNLFLWPGRDWVRKGLEVWFTPWMELLWSKRRILEVYLNIIEFGPGIYGIEAASRHYFNKPAARLTAGEAASLAVILPDPLRYNPLRLGPYLQQRRAWALAQMQRRGPLFPLTR